MAKTEVEQVEQQVKEAEVVEAPKKEVSKEEIPESVGAPGATRVKEGGGAMRGAVKTEISWEAEEYVVRDKNAGWYVGMVVIGLLLSALAIWLQAWTFLAVIVLSVVALLVYTLRPPRMLHYSLTERGLSEGTHLYNYDDFKAFGILKEGQHFAIVLTPRKRFSPRVTVFFPEARGEAIVDAFGARLPMEEVRLDALDRLIKFLRI